MTFKRFCFAILKPYRPYLLGMLSTGLIWGVAFSLSPYILKLVIDHLAKSKPIHEIYPLALLYIGLNILTAMNFRALEWIKYKMFPTLKKDTAAKMFDYIKHHSHDFFQNHFAGSISKRVDDMVINLEALLLSADLFFANVASFLIAIVVMYTVNPWFALALLCWWTLFFLISFLLSNKILKLSNKTSAAYATYAGTLVDIIANFSSVRLFSRLDYETKKLDKDINELVKKDRKMLKYIFKMRVLQDCSFIGLLALMFYILINLYEKKLVTIGDFALILTITMSIFQLMWQIANQIVDVYKNIGRCHQAMTLLQIPHEITDHPNATKLKATKGEIEFKDVNFSYQNGPPLFVNKNIKIQAGTKVGLVGFSGSGKSTFINLVLRLYDVLSGVVLIDGHNISEVSQQSLRENISMIPQDISLFHRSLFDNIKYGKIDATNEEVIDASKRAHCHEFISNLNEGYDTLVGERGIKLSGGQRQRIAIARAFLENAPILIMDEATSSLDSVTEQFIQENLMLTIQNRTTIFIAHRLSTLLKMDRILVFKAGKIIEDGNHETLLKANKHYAKLWTMQSNGFLPDDPE